MDNVQNTLIQELHCGVLTEDTFVQRASSSQDQSHNPLPLDNACSYMSESWVRASMIIRVNSLAKGNSGIRDTLIQSILDLLKNNIVPLIPLRGSISASGDLVPLSYIAGAIQGDRNIMVWMGPSGDRQMVSADVALSKASLSPVVLAPKEGLAIVNGTAVSAGVAALAIQNVNCLAILSQITTAMNVEALMGTKESFDPLFAQVRPHPGQIEASRNILSFLSESQLARSGNSDLDAGSLYQDRYSTRTAAQWIAPVLEDLQLASQQVSIEINSVTDNPLVDRDNRRVLNGGNFQARVISSAMEKTRQGMQTIGQMIFAQCTELINPKLSRGLVSVLPYDLGKYIK